MHQFWKDFIARTYQERRDQIIDDTFFDYHVKGFNSVLLLKHDALNIRLYVTKRGEHNLNNPNDNTLWIHNHQFGFECITLAGYMSNLTYRESDKGKTHYKYKYISKLQSTDGIMKLEPQGTINLEFTNNTLCHSDSRYHHQHYRFDSDQLHKIAVPNDRHVAMLFFEHAHTNPDIFLYSKEPLPERPPTDGLYRKPSPKEVDELIKFTLSL